MTETEARSAGAHRLPTLDSLRGVAVVAVVLFHLGVAPGGFMGVDVFFVLSGYLITTILLGEQQRTGGLRLRRFYLRRLLRLYPALLAVCLFCLAVAIASGQAVSAVSHDALFSVLYLSNLVELRSGLLGHTWTLSLEEQFYLVWPAVLVLGLHLRRSGSARLAWLPAILLVVVIAAIDLAQGADGAMHSYVRAMGLPLGCALAIAVSASRARWLSRLWPGCAVLLVVAVFVPLPASITTGWPVSIGAVLAVPLVSRAASGPIRGFSNQALRWFGLRSYSLYLWHLPLISLAANQGPASIPEPARLVLGLLASLAAAELSYRFVEQTVLKWRDRTVPSGGTVAGV